MAMLRYNAGKPPLTLVPTAFIKAIASGFERDYTHTPTLLIEDVARVLEFGSKKYNANNWRKGGPWNSVLDCAFRHLNKLFRGETHDDESGIHHLAHVGCNIAFLLEFIEQKSGEDDRYSLATMWKPAGYSEDDFLNLLYDELLRWKDGDQFAIYGSAVILSKYYETLKPEVVAGSSPYAQIQNLIQEGLITKEKLAASAITAKSIEDNYKKATKDAARINWRSMYGV